MEIDFIDINMGCPIDLVYKKGQGSALMNRISKLEQVHTFLYELRGSDFMKDQEHCSYFTISSDQIKTFSQKDKFQQEQLRVQFVGVCGGGYQGRWIMGVYVQQKQKIKTGKNTKFSQK